MNYKLISMDLDGTLLTQDKKVTINTKNILNEYRKSGIKIVGITARNYSSIKQVMDISIFDYIIINNGAFIINVETCEIEKLGLLTKDDVTLIYDTFKDARFKLEFVSLNKYFKNYDFTKNREFEYRINDVKEITEDIARVNVILNTKEEIDYYKKYIESNMKSVNVVSMIDTDSKNSQLWLTLNKNNTNKLIALKNLISKFNINLEEVIFFGDGENDLLIIQNVGLGIAMGNAIEIVKEKSKDVTLSNDEEGIYYYLKNKLNY